MHNVDHSAESEGAMSLQRRQTSEMLIKEAIPKSGTFSDYLSSEKEEDDSRSASRNIPRKVSMGSRKIAIIGVQLEWVAFTEI